MKFTDFSPPAAPTHEEQRDALQKGLGRAVQWARAGVLDGGLLREACLDDLRYDKQCEDTRGEWLWKLIVLSDRKDELRDPVLSALRTVSEAANAYQFADLGYHFAKNGDGAFRTALHEFVQKRPVPEHPNIGEGVLLALDGLDAFRFLSKIHGLRLEGGEWEWNDDAMVDRAIDYCGEIPVREILADPADPDLARFAVEWQKHRLTPVDPDERQKSYLQEMRAISAADLIQKAVADSSFRRYRGWGADAPETELTAVLDRIWKEQDPEVLARLLTVFSNRPLPQFDARLIDLCRHPNEEVTRRALSALKQNAHPLVRDFALNALREGTLSPLDVDLFIKNFEPGDEQRLLDELEVSDDPWDRHCALLDIVHVLEENETADCLRLGLIAYFQTPCSKCRYWAARLLADSQQAPDWLIEECREDANEECWTVDAPQEDE